MFTAMLLALVLRLSCPAEDAACVWMPCIHGNGHGTDLAGQTWDCRPDLKKDAQP